jgi:hypothetical protein
MLCLKELFFGYIKKRIYFCFLLITFLLVLEEYYMFKFLKWHKYTFFIMLLFTTGGWTATYAPDSIRIATLPMSIYYSTYVDSMVISNLDRAKADGYNYARLSLSLTMFYWWYWTEYGNNGSPFISQGASAGTMTTDAKNHFKNLIMNAFKQANKYGIKLVPNITLGQHGWCYGWGYLSDSISWNYKRFDSLTRNIPLTHSSGYPFFQKSIGSSSMIGSGYFYADTATWIRPISIKGFGRGINKSAVTDTFHYVFEEINAGTTNTCYFRTQVDSIQNTNDSAKAGVMFRESLISTSPYVMISSSRNQGIRFQYRKINGGTATVSKSNTIIPYPCRLKIIREYISTNNLIDTCRFIGCYISGVGDMDDAWTNYDTCVIGMSQSKGNFMGLAVTSSTNGTSTTCNALFKKVGSVGSPVFPIASTPCGVDAGTGGFDKVYSYMLSIFNDAFSSVKSQLSYSVLEYINLGYDETVSKWDTVDAYVMVGESKKDSIWIKNKLPTSYTSDTLQKLTQQLISYDLRRRVDTMITKTCFTSTKAMLWADMWDKNQAGCGKNLRRSYYNPLMRVYIGKNPGVAATSDALAEKDKIILLPWHYENYPVSSPLHYNTYSTDSSFQAFGYKIIFNWAISEGSNMVDQPTALQEIIYNNWLKQFYNAIVGYSSDYYYYYTKGDEASTNALSMEYMHEWTYFASLYAQ